MRLQVLVLIPRCDSNVEVGVDLVDEANVLACELARGAFQRPQVDVEKRPAFRCQFDVAELGAQCLRSTDELTRLRRRGVLGDSTQFGITGVRVDETVFESVETQAQQQVFANQGSSIHIRTLVRRTTPPVRGGQAPSTIWNHATRARQEHRRILSSSDAQVACVSESSPYVEFDRVQWRTLRQSTPLVLTEEELVGLRGLGEQIDLDEVAEVYCGMVRKLVAS